MSTRVMHVIPSFFPGGAERIAVHILSNLDRSRFEGIAVSLYDPYGSDLEDILRAHNVPIFYLGKNRGLDTGVFSRMNELMRKFKPHVVHTHQYVTRYVLPSSLAFRIPVKVHTIHNMAEGDSGKMGRVVNWISFRLGVVPVAIAKAVAASIEGCYHVSPIPLIYNGIPVEYYRHPEVPRVVWRSRYGFGSDDVLFCTVGRLHPQKHHELMIDAFARGPAADSRSHLLMAGDGSLREQLTAYVSELGLSEKVHFIGERSDIPDVLAASDAFVLSSSFEGNPLCVMEAMAAGKPVISTAVGGVPELLTDGVTGVLVPSDDADGLASAMQQLLRDPVLYRTMGANGGRAADERFSVQAMTRSYEGLYTQLLGAIGTRGRGRYVGIS